MDAGLLTCADAAGLAKLGRLRVFGVRLAGSPERVVMESKAGAVFGPRLTIDARTDQ